MIAASDLADEPFVSLASPNSTRLKVDALFKNEDIHRRLMIEASWSTAVIGFVAQGNGATILDPFSAATAAALGCSLHRMAQPIAFSFAEIKASSSAENELAALFSDRLDQRLRKLHGFNRPKRPSET